MIYLRQSTASQEIALGQFLDSTDGDTEEAGLTIANTDIKIWKAGATTLANKNSGGGTYISNGVYYAVLDATDTNTLGSGIIFVHVSGALAVRLEFCVITANWYDTMFSTDILDVNTTHVSGTAQTANDNGADINAILVDTDDLQGNQGDWLTATGFATSGALTTHDGKLDTVDGIVDNILVDTGTTLPAQLDSMSGGTFDTATDSLEAIRDRGDAAWVTGAGGSSPTVEQIRTEMDDNSTQLAAIVADTGEIGTAGAGLTNINLPNQTMDIVGNITGNLSGSVGSVTADVTTDSASRTASQADVSDIPTVAEFNARTLVSADYVVTSDTIAGVTLCATTTTNTDMRGTDGANTAVPDVAGTAATLHGITDGKIDTVDTVVDSILALLDDPRSEPGQGAPAVNADAMTKLDYLYKFMRNKKEQTATEFSLYNDAGAVVDQKSTVSDDGTTATVGEIVTGA